MNEQESGMAVYPPEAMITKEAWEKIEAADQLHQSPPIGHYVTVERGQFSGRSMERPACLCGWRGEWARPK